MTTRLNIISEASLKCKYKLIFCLLSSKTLQVLCSFVLQSDSLLWMLSSLFFQNHKNCGITPITVENCMCGDFIKLNCLLYKDLPFHHRGIQLFAIGGFKIFQMVGYKVYGQPKINEHFKNFKQQYLKSMLKFCNSNA